MNVLPSSWSLEGSMCQLMEHHHGAACGKGFVSEPHACRTTAEQQQLTLLASCRVQHNWELPATNAKKDRFWLQTRSQKLIPKMKPFLASPNETIEAVSQKLKLKMASVKRDTNCEKKCCGAQKKTPSECARQPFYRCSHNLGVCLA